MAEEVLLYLSLIITIAAIITVLARLIKQPPIIAYLIAGVLVGPLFLDLIGPGSPHTALIQIFAHIGVAFLLFIVGLNLDVRVFKELGKVSMSAGLAEIIATGVIGFIIAILLKFDTTTSIYLGAALAFSSTVVVVKILSDKKEIDTLHGRIALGILIVEDIVATIALMTLPLLENGGSALLITKKIGIIIGLIIFIFIVTAFMHKKLLDYLARSQEALFLFGIAWALVLATLFDFLGFSLEIGALIAGMSLATSKYTLELGGKMKPLRDFFVVLFFVFFGSQLVSTINQSLIIKALIFSIFIIVGKPIIVMTVLKAFGYTKKTNFLASSSLAQISEFSLILILLGFTLGHINEEVMSLAVLIAIITIGVSSYSIYYARAIFNKIGHLLSIFEVRNLQEYSEQKVRSPEIILFGYHRTGYKILETIKKLKSSFVVVDYNPKVVLALNKENIECIYGDAGDKGFLSEIEMDKVKLIISTIPDEESNLAIKEMLKQLKSKAVFIATAEQPRIALDLYEEGIDYVIIPHHLGGDYVSYMIANYGTNKEKYRAAGKVHLEDLEKAKGNSTFS